MNGDTHVAVLPIVLTSDHNDVLTTKATRVPRVDDAIRRLMDDMVETMFEANGVGLAAPQVGVSLRVIVLRVDNQIYQIANPEMVRCEGDQTGLEGCLSVPGWVGEVTRCQRVVAKGIEPPRQGGPRSRVTACWRARSSTRSIISTASSSPAG